MARLLIRRGGHATPWPWRQVEVRLFKRCLSLTVSRQYPKEQR